VIDAGHGFESREVIEKCFKTFGTPHVEGDAKFGRFRIGRGQVMGLAAMCWHSNQFKMRTDVLNKGNGFFLTEDNNDVFQGCRVTGDLYSELNDYELESTIQKIKVYVRFMEEHITLNGILISQKNHDQWDFENDDLKIKFSPKRENGIFIYSQGVYVKSIHSHEFGFNADVVTKKALKLNMARNEISDNDPLWTSIIKILREHSIKIAKENSKNNRMDENGRQSAIKNFLQGSLSFSDILKMKLIRDSRNRLVEIKQFVFSKKPITVARHAGCKISDTLSTRGIALVLHHDECRIWDIYEPSDIADLLEKAVTKEFFNRKVADGKSIDLKIDSGRMYLRGLRQLKFVNFDKISEGISSEVEIIKNNELTNKQRAARLALEYASRVVSKQITDKLETHKSKRKILIGKSLTSLAWTDGNSYIAINESVLEWLDKGISGMTSVCNILMHEYLHDVNDSASHEHDFDFYQNFHDASIQNIVGSAVSSLHHQYQRELLKLELPLPDALTTIPLVNVIQEYTGVMAGKGLSELAQLFLEATGATYTTTKTAFTCQISHLKQLKQGMYLSIIEKLTAVAAQDGWSIPTDDDYLHLNDFMEQTKRYYDDLTNSLILWSESKGYDSNMIRNLKSQISISSKPIHYMPSNAALCASIYKGFEGVLQLICNDANSGLLHFTTKTLSEVSLLGNGKFLHEVPFSKEAYISKLSEKANSDKTHRFEQMTKAIVELLASMTDPDEKEEFLNIYFKKEMAIQCN
jgi:hypothetical protein